MQLVLHFKTLFIPFFFKVGKCCSFTKNKTLNQSHTHVFQCKTATEIFRKKNPAGVTCRLQVPVVTVGAAVQISVHPDLLYDHLPSLDPLGPLSRLVRVLNLLPVTLLLPLCR